MTNLLLSVYFWEFINNLFRSTQFKGSSGISRFSLVKTPELDFRYSKDPDFLKSNEVECFCSSSVLKSAVTF